MNYRTESQLRQELAEVWQMYYATRDGAKAALDAAVAAERERCQPTEAAIKAAIYEQCPDFDEWHEGPSLDDVLAIVRRACGPNAELSGPQRPARKNEYGTE